MRGSKEEAPEGHETLTRAADLARGNRTAQGCCPAYEAGGPNTMSSDERRSGRRGRFVRLLIASSLAGLATVGVAAACTKVAVAGRD